MIGTHLTVDSILKKMPSEGEIRDVLLNMPSKIDMNILQGPVIIKGAQHNPGWTGFVIIDMSHIAIHTFDDSKKISIDIFSCKIFDTEKALEYLKGKFEFDEDSMNVNFLERKIRQKT